MKSSKRTTGRSILPFGNDIFDVIDYYFTSTASYEKGRDAERKRVYEIVKPTYEELKREHATDLQRVKTREWVIGNIDQKIAQKQNRLIEVMKKKTPEAAKEAAKLQESIAAFGKHKREEMELLERARAALKRSTSGKEKLQGAIDQMMWGFLDRHGRVLAKGPTKEDLVQKIIAKAERGGPGGERVLEALKWIEKETGASSADFEEMFGEIQSRAGKNIPEELKRNKLMSLLSRPGSEQYLRSPKKK